MNKYFKIKEEDQEKLNEVLLSAGIEFSEVLNLYKEVIEHELHPHFESCSETIEELREKYAENVDPETFFERLKEVTIEDVLKNVRPMETEHLDMGDELRYLLDVSAEARQYVRIGK